MLFYLIMNLCVPFGIPFDPKRYYKDGDCALILRRPRAIWYMALPPRDQRNRYLRYEGLKYTEADIEDFESRLARIYKREVHRVHVFDFRGLPNLMVEGLSARMLMEHREAQGKSVFGEAVTDLDIAGALQFQLVGARRRLRWRKFILALGLHTDEEMQTARFDAYWADRMDVDSVNVPYLLARYLRLFAAGRKSRAHIFGGQFVARLAEHFRLLTMEILQGLTIIAPAFPVIDMAKLPDATASAPRVAEDAPVIDEVCQANPAPVQELPSPPAAAKTMPQRMARLEEDVHKICGTLAEQHDVISVMARDFSRFCTWTTTSLAHMMNRACVTYTSYSQTPREYQRHVRCMTDDASTSTAQQDPQQPNL
ncbi:hypothetical protein Tco_0368090 [Tanacetum coccineum]